LIARKNQNLFYEVIAVGTRRLDFLVEEKILIELKAITQLENVHLAQAINYIAFELEVGLLINFGATSLQFRRLQNKHKYLIKDHPSINKSQFRQLIFYSLLSAFTGLVEAARNDSKLMVIIAISNAAPPANRKIERSSCVL
jgi:hypothetical protein